jgi:hypothetical protein
MARLFKNYRGSRDLGLKGDIFKPQRFVTIFSRRHEQRIASFRLLKRFHQRTAKKTAADFDNGHLVKKCALDTQGLF